MNAHVGGLPVEETLPLLLGGAGTGVLVVRAWLESHVRKRRRSRSTAGPR